MILDVKDGVSLWTIKQIGFGAMDKSEKNLNQNALLLSLADIGHSDFTRWEPLLLISRPWKQPRGSWCNESERPRTWAAAESIGCWWLDVPAGMGLNCDICTFCESFWPDWGWGEKKADWWYGTCCIVKLNVSELVDISPVAILSLSTSCFSASLSATYFKKL